MIMVPNKSIMANLFDTEEGKALTNRFSLEKMLRVVQRERLIALYGKTSKEVMLKYAKYNSELSTLDLYVLASLGDLTYDTEYTQRMLISMSNRFIRAYLLNNNPISETNLDRLSEVVLEDLASCRLLLSRDLT